MTFPAIISSAEENEQERKHDNCENAKGCKVDLNKIILHDGNDRIAKRVRQQQVSHGAVFRKEIYHRGRFKADHKAAAKALYVDKRRQSARIQREKQP